MLGLALGGGFVGVTQAHAATECSDGVDNDNDDRVDFPADPDCTSASDTSEFTPANECVDGRDNDGDGLTDSSDPSCANGSTSESASTGGTAQCGNGVDDDGDDRVDYPADPDCTSATDTTETGSSNECADGRDNDGDGRFDGQDTGCQNGGTRESGSTSGGPQCSDGTDNDGDDRVDFPADPDCTSATDGDESGSANECADGRDNDGDGRFDGEDSGCQTSNRESGSTSGGPQCSDGIDNDGDDRVDYPADPDCTSAADPAELGSANECADGRDNDGDGRFDGQDSGCQNGGTNEGPSAGGQCSNNIDDDSDGRIDYPADPDCSSAADPTEGTGSNQCNDGRDNDGDGRFDMEDSGCQNGGTSETDPTPSAYGCATGGLDGETIANVLSPGIVEDGPVSFLLHRDVERILGGAQTPAEILAAYDTIFGSLPPEAQAELRDGYEALRAELVGLGPALGGVLRPVIHEVSCLVALAEDVVIEVVELLPV